nr:class I SAM-dependent methyltransferase [uncultured Rhodopila sp.]
MSTTVDETTVPLLTGPRHELVLTALHRILKPRTYLEIGIERGDTLRAAQCATIAIDPVFTVDQSIIGSKPECLLYRMPSDRFFELHDPVTLLGDRIDMAFLDGLHLYEFLLRDFINVERSCRKNSLILLHDCVPTDFYLARRLRQDESLRPNTRIPGGWCGDVWKTLLILRQYRPDLRIECFDAALTGLVVVTNLDPKSEVLSAKYVEAVESFAKLDLRDYGLRRYHDELNMLDARTLIDPTQLARYAWL